MASRRESLRENLPVFESSGRFLNQRIEEIDRILQRVNFDDASLNFIEREIELHRSEYRARRDAAKRRAEERKQKLREQRI